MALIKLFSLLFVAARLAFKYAFSMRKMDHWNRRTISNAETKNTVREFFLKCAASLYVHETRSMKLVAQAK